SPSPTPFPYTPLFRSPREAVLDEGAARRGHASGADMSGVMLQMHSVVKCERRAVHLRGASTSVERQRQRDAAAKRAAPSCEEERSEEHTSELQSRVDL